MTSETTWVEKDVLLADKTTSTVRTTCAREQERGTSCLSAGVRLALYTKAIEKSHKRRKGDEYIIVSIFSKENV